MQACIEFKRHAVLLTSMHAKGNNLARTHAAICQSSRFRLTLSVSISAMLSPAATSSPSFFFQEAIFPA